MYITSFHYANWQEERHSSAFSLFPVTAANIAAQQRKEYPVPTYFPRKKKEVSEKMIQSTLAEITSKGRYINEHV
jgi:hypothetical protein